MTILLIRTIILYFLALFVIRMMGKRQIGELQPFELVITVMISELTTLPMQDTRIPLIHAVIPVLTLLFLQVTTSYLQLKSEKARLIISGRPSILIDKGNIDIEELKKQKINLNDLLEEIRLKDCFNLEDIEYAILETSGQLSIIPRSSRLPPSREDMDIPHKQEQLPVTLILDGNINYSNLKVIHKDITWLKQNLLDNNITDPKKVFIALLNSKGEFYYQLREKDEL